MGKLLDAFEEWLESHAEEEFSNIWEDTYEKVSDALEDSHNLTNK